MMRARFAIPIRPGVLDPGDSALIVCRGLADDRSAKLELSKGDRIILIGNTLAERMQYFGNFETLLQSPFPDLNLVVHDLGWSADEITLRPRSAGFQGPRPYP